MADNIEFQAPSFNASLTVEVKGKEEIEALGRTLDQISHGTAFQNYWKTQEALINDVTRAMENFQRTANKTNATELLNSANALKAVANVDTSGLAGLSKSFADISTSLSSAKDILGGRGFISESEFQGAFKSFQALAASGADVNEILSKLSTSADTDVLRSALETVTTELANMRQRAEEAEATLEEFQAGSGVDKLKEELDAATQSLSELKSQASKEFEAFLSANDISRWDSSAIDYFNNIYNGSMSAKEAIADFKSEYSYMLSSGGSVDSSQIAEFASRLEEIYTRVEEISQSMRSMGDGAGFTTIATGTSEIAQSSQGLQATAAAFRELASGIATAGSDSSGMYEQLNGMFKMLTELGSIEAGNLTSIVSMFDNLGRLNGMDVKAAPFKALADALDQIARIPNITNLSVLSTVNLSKFGELTVRKASMSNLAEFLPTIANVNVGNLAKLSTVDLTNFNNISVKKSSVEALSQLADALRGININALTALGKSLSGDSAEATLSNAAKRLTQNLEKEQSALNIESAMYDHVAALHLAEEAEMDKAAAAELLTEQLKQETAAFRTASSAAGAYNTIANGTGSSGKSTKSGGTTSKVTYAGDEQLTSVNNLLTTIQNALNRVNGYTSDAAVNYRNALSPLLSDLQTLAEDIDTGTLKMGDFRDRLAAIKAVLSGVKFDFASESQNGFKTIEKDTEDYYNALNKIQGALNSLNSLKDKASVGKAVVDPQAAAEIDELIGKLNNLQATLIGGDKAQVAKEIDSITSSISRLKGESQQTGSILSGFFGKMGAGVKQYAAMMFSSMRIIQTVIREVKEMVNTAIELDSAFTQLQIVTRVSDSTMDSFSKTVAATAKDMSASVKDLVEVATVYSRLGYSLDESNVLAKYTAMLQNVGDIDPSASSDAITAIVKAFNLGVEDIETVMDKMVEVGNNFPISVSQIAEGINNAASMMANAGMSFDQSVAMLTAANTTVQNISKSSTGLRTIIARLRNVKSELDDAGEVWNEAKYQELISALTKGGVSLQDATGALRNPYEVLRDLASKWSSLSSDIQAAITAALAGTRQQDVFSSLMNQFGEATGAMEAMANSAGSLEEAYAIFEDSMQGHINVLKAAFEELSMEAVDSGFVNNIIDTGTAILGVLTPVAGILGDITSALGPLGIAINAVGIAAFYKSFKTGMAAVVKSAEEAGTSLTTFQKIAQTLSSTSVLPWIGGITAALGAATIAYNVWKQHVEAMRQAATESYNEYSNSASSINEYKERIYELRTALDSGNLSYQDAYDAREELISIQGALVEAVGSEAAAFDILGDSIESVNEKLENKLLLDADQTYRENQEVFDAAVRKMTGYVDGAANLSESAEELEPLLRLLEQEFGDASVELTRLNSVGQGDLFGLEVKSENAREFADSIDAIRTKVLGMSDIPEAIRDEWLSALLEIRSNADSIIDNYGDHFDQYIDLQIALNPDYSSLESQADEVMDAITEAITSGDYTDIANALFLAQDWTKAFGEMEIDDYSVKKFFEGLQSKMQQFASSEGGKLLFRADIEAGSIDDIKEALDSFVDEDGGVSLRLLQQAEQAARSFEAIVDSSSLGELDQKIPAEVQAFYTLNRVIQAHGSTISDVIPILIEFGLIQDDIIDQSELVKETAWFGGDIADGVDDLAEKFEKLREAQEKLDEGTLELEDVLELMATFPELAEYVDWTTGSLENFGEGLKVANRNAPKDLIRTLEELRDSGRLDESVIPQIDALIDRLYEMPDATFAVDELTLKYGSLAETVEAAKKEVELLDAAINTDTNKGYQTRMSAIEEMMELFAVGATASESKLWNIAKWIGAPEEYINNLDRDGLFAWTDRWSQYISENPYDSSGVENWLKDVSDIVSANQELFDALGATWSYDGETLDFDVPNDKVADFLDLIASLDETMSMTPTLFYDMLMQAGQFFDLNWSGPEDAIADMKNAFADVKAAKEELDKALSSENQVDIDVATENLSAAQEQLKNIADVVLALQEATGIDLGVTVTTDDDGNIIELIVNGETLSLDADLNVTAPEETDVDVGTNVDTSNIPTDIADSVTDMDPIDVPTEVNGDEIRENVQEAVSGATGGAEPIKLDVNTDDAQRKIKSFQSLINGIKAKTVTIRASVTGSNAINSLYKQINQLRDKTVTVTTRQVTVYKSSGKKTSDVNGTAHANGSAHAGGNWGIKRDETALVGELGPEIVVRDGRWFTVGDYGAQFAALRKGDIVFNHKQAEALFRNGYVAGRGRALAEGSAYVSSSGSVKKSYTSSIYNYSNKYGTSSSSSSSKSSGAYTSSSRTTTTTTTTKNTDLENWFEQQYAYHQHLVAMEQESQAAFLDWLVTAYKKAYNEGIIALEDSYKYAEEVFDGLRDLYEDYLSDTEHEVSMREHFKGEEQNIINLYRKAIASVEEEIATARKAGLDDNDTWIQTLQDRWWQYIEYLQDLEDDYTDEVKDAVGELIDLRIDMLKQDIKDEKDAISERLKNLKSFYKQQKDMLKDAYDEDKYLKEQTEKRKAVADLQLQIDQLSLDNSAWAQKRRLELQQKLADAQEDLDEFEKDHALDVAQDALDALYDKQEAALNKQTDLLDEKLDYARGLYEQALEDIRSGSEDLYKDMIEYNAYYGSGIDSEITESWEAAYAALDDYFNLFQKRYNDINLENVTGYKTEGGWDTQLISDKGYAAYVAANPSAAATTTTTTTTTTSSSSSSGSTTSSSSSANSNPYGKVSSVSGNIAYGSRGNSVKALQYALNQLGYGNSGTKSLDGVFGAGTRTAVYNFQRAMGLAVDGIVGPNTKAAFKKKGYASGTSHATAGIHRFGENGTEFMFTSANGNKYRLFSSGDKVLDAKSTNFLYQFATTGGRVLTEMIGTAIKDYASSGAISTRNIGSIRMGDIIIQGNADERTVSEIRREQRAGIDYILSKFTQLSY